MRILDIGRINKLGKRKMKNPFDRSRMPGAGAVGGTCEAGETGETGVATCETDACPAGRHRI